jgi:cytoskeletal protein RodZ
MADRASGDLGRRLREARERRGVPLRQIAATTKIGVGVLEALERNDFSRLPGGIFGRAFVRSYAIEVGLDPEATVQEFIELLPQPAGAGQTRLMQPEDHEAVESDRRIATAVVRLVAVSAPLVAAILYLGSTGRPVAGPTTEPVAVERNLAQVPASPPAAPSSSTFTTADVDQMTVALAALRDCWVAAVVDGDRVIDRLMQSGERQTLEVRRELLLTAGDASALAVTINGAPVRALGESGQVITARLDLTNFREYLANP